MIDNIRTALDNNKSFIETDKTESRSWAFNAKYQNKIKNNDKDDFLKSNLKPNHDTWNYDGRRPS